MTFWSGDQGSSGGWNESWSAAGAGQQTGCGAFGAGQQMSRR